MADDVWLVRHGETEWARLGRHTGRTDIPLTDVGRDQARALGRRLAGHPFALVLTSPAVARGRHGGPRRLRRGRRSRDPDLQEWDYGDLEGRLTVDIREDPSRLEHLARPVAGRRDHRRRRRKRADRVLARLAEVDGDALVVAHGHLLRVLAARWLGLPPASGGLFALGTATVSRPRPRARDARHRALERGARHLD